MNDRFKLTKILSTKLSNKQNKTKKNKQTNKKDITKDILFQRYKMNEIISKFLLVRDKSTPEMHLRQPGITYSACVLFTKNNERIQKCKETEDSRYI